MDPKKDKKKIEKFCGAGTYMTTYDVDGKSYGCHMFSPIVLGCKAVEKNKIDYKCSSFALDAICMNCILKHFCPTCAGFNYKYRDSFSTKDKSKCALHFQEAIVSANFQIKF